MLHTCAPPRDEHPKAHADWICPVCGAMWEAAAGVGIFDFDRNEAVTRAEWLLVEGPTILAG